MKKKIKISLRLTVRNCLSDDDDPTLRIGTLFSNENENKLTWE